MSQHLNTAIIFGVQEIPPQNPTPKTLNYPKPKTLKPVKKKQLNPQPIARSFEANSAAQFRSGTGCVAYKTPEEAPVELRGSGYRVE